MIITKATYGEKDCTQIVQSKVIGNKLILRADNNIMGDTNPGVVKYLEIEGNESGEVFKERVREGDTLVYPKTKLKRLGVWYTNNTNNRSEEHTSELQSH